MPGDAPLLLFELVDVLVGAGWLLLLAMNVRELRTYPSFTLGPSYSPLAAAGGLVSVIVPARNEERRIRPCLESLTGQTHADLEVIVVDDRSTDGTAGVVSEIGGRDPRVALVRGDALPPGWAGKNWACFQGSRRARGAWLLFVDSDTVLEPSAVSAALSYAESHGLGALSLVPRADYDGAWARAVGPVLSWLIRLLFPLRRVNDPRDGLAVAVGGFFMMGRDAYARVGGHEAVRDELVEDKQIATNLKAAGVPYRLMMGRELAVVGLFTGGQGVWDSVRRVATNPLKTARWLKLLFVVAGLLLLTFPVAYLLLAAAVGVASVTDILIALLSVSAPAVIVTHDIAGTFRSSYWYAPLATVGGVVIMLAILREFIGGKAVGWRGRSYGGPRAGGVDGG